MGVQDPLMDVESSARRERWKDQPEVCKFLGPGFARGHGAHEALLPPSWSSSLLGHQGPWTAHQDKWPSPWTSMKWRSTAECERYAHSLSMVKIGYGGRYTQK